MCGGVAMGSGGGGFTVMHELCSQGQTSTGQAQGFPPWGSNCLQPHHPILLLPQFLVSPISCPFLAVRYGRGGGYDRALFHLIFQFVLILFDFG